MTRLRSESRAAVVRALAGVALAMLVVVTAAGPSRAHSPKPGGAEPHDGQDREQVRRTAVHEVPSERDVEPQVDCPLGCDDGNSCTDDACDPVVGCVHTNSTAACTDGNACTTNDRCTGGTCVGGDRAPGCSACAAVAQLPPGGGTFAGTTTGTSSLTGTCDPGGTSPERVFAWTPATSGTATFETCGNGTAFDTTLSVRSGSCSGSWIACNDDGPCGNAVDPAEASRLSLPVTVGQTYYIVVGGYNGDKGAFTLRVVSPSVCGNDVREGSEECDGTDAAACGAGSCDASCACTPSGGAMPDLVPEVVDWYLQFGATVDPGDVAEGCAEQLSGSDLLRFGVRTLNLGNGDLFLGNPQCPSPCTDHPLEICGNSNFICSPAGGHNHGHYLDYAVYELLDASNQVVVVGHKQGFCLLDGFDSGVPCPGRKFTCTYQGLTVGCADLYESSLGCQYLDITDIPAGEYTLRIRVDPQSRIAEVREDNNVVTVPVTITGDACNNVQDIAPGGGTVTGTTVGDNTVAGGCNGTGTSPERVFRWRPALSGIATFSTCSTVETAYDTVVYVRAGACDGPQLGCNDDGPCAISGSPVQGSRLSLSVTAGQAYYVFVDGYLGAKGPFGLTVTAPTTCTPNGAPCDDGNACTTGDACSGGACVGSPPTAPQEVNDTVRLDPAPGATAISWQDAPGPFVVYRGSLPADTTWAYDHTCLAGPNPDPSALDAQSPAAGDLFWYLVTRKSSCGESIAGRDGAGTPVAPGPACSGGGP